MNPQYMNQQPPGPFGGAPPVSGYPPSSQLYGAPPTSQGFGAQLPQGYPQGPPPTSQNYGAQPPSSLSSQPTFNGPGVPGTYGPPPMKGGMSVPNGPQSGPQMPASQPPQRPPAPGAQPPGPPPGPRGPPHRPQQPSVNQVSNQIGAMNVSGPPQRPGPPSLTGPAPVSMQNSVPAPQQGVPPPVPRQPIPMSKNEVPSSAGAPPPLQQMRQPAVSLPSGPQPAGQPISAPPSGPRPGMPPQSSGHFTGQAPAPTSQYGGQMRPPTSQFGGLPPTTSQFGGQPPPTSQFGGHMPPNSNQFGGQVPTPASQIGGQPAHAGHFPGQAPPQVGEFGGQPNNLPPSSQFGGSAAPPTSQFGGQPPPGKMGGPHAPPPVGQMGAQAPVSTNQRAPPPSPGHQMPPGSGQFPPQPGYMGAGGMPPQPSQPQQPPRRLDPDQMPSPIQVIEDDRRNRGGLYQSTIQGGVPPLVTTNFIVEDQGTCNPRFMRSSMYNIPCTNEMMKQSHMPFVVTLTPFAKLHPKENAPPLVDLGQLGPIRCNRCKAYMCPYMQFIDGGRRFQCCFCGCSTEVPPEYFAHLDHTGRRVDTYDRPELCLGTYEFVATADYCKDNKLPGAPAFIFMIDVSYNSVKSGLVHLLCSRLKEDILPNLPKEEGMDESEIRVGFVTYAKELHFYNVKGSLAQPQMMVVSDIQDVFVPLLDGFLVKLSESEAVIDSLLSQIPTMFGESRETEIILGPVIQAGLDALKSADISGKLFIFHSSLPTAEAPGKLKNRDDRKLMGTEKEKTVLTPQGNFYTKLGQECVAAGCSVDLYLFPNSYMDIASIAEVPRLSGGSVFKYTYFQADLDGVRLMSDLKNNVSKPIAFDAIIRLRTSTGIRPVDFLGNFYMSNTTDVEMASVDCDKAITVEIKHDDKLNESDGAHIQTAVLYTSSAGQRRLRIINMAFPVCNQMSDLFRNCELDVVVNYLAKQSIRQCLNTSPKQVREELMNRCSQILACYRKNCASPSSAGQLILPECMKLLPVYTNCIIKSGLLQGGTEIGIDDRSYIINTVNGMGIKATHAFFYPRLLPLVEPESGIDAEHDIDTDGTAVPSSVRCSYERLHENGVYILENGLLMFMWIGHNINPEWVQNVFGVQSAAQIDIDKSKLQDLDNAMSRRVRAVVRRVCEERQRQMKLFIVRQRDKLEPVFQQYLMEDRSANGSASYVDFLCHIHKEIRNLLS